MVIVSYTAKHLYEWIQPDKLRALEVILGCAWDSKVDIWNLGLVVRAPYTLLFFFFFSPFLFV